MYNPLKTEACKKCGNLIAEPKELRALSDEQLEIGELSENDSLAFLEDE
jgi:hypothetical protein